MKTISRKHKFLLAVIAGILIIGMYVLSACSDAGKGAENDVEELGENQYLVYYLDETGQALTSEVYTAKVADDPIKLAHDYGKSCRIRRMAESIQVQCGGILLL